MKFKVTQQGIHIPRCKRIVAISSLKQNKNRSENPDYFTFWNIQIEIIWMGGVFGKQINNFVLLHSSMIQKQLSWKILREPKCV